MVKVTVTWNQQVLIGLRVTGHANSAEVGQDLVCASVSSIATGALNALDLIVHDACELTLVNGPDPLIDINVKHNRPEVQPILRAVLIQLKTLAENQSRYIRIQEVHA
jgi:uncharacterized protein